MQQFASQELASRIEVCIKALDESKALDINTISFEKKGMMADALVITSGTSNVHMQAIAHKLVDKLKENKIKCSIEGANSDIWVLVDCGDIVIHIFSEESRSFYALEKLWSNINDSEETE
jgi:ribosome-associated protein